VKSTRVPKPANAEKAFPGIPALAALRAWYAGQGARAAVAQYLGQDKASGQSSRAMLSDIRRQLADYARERHREDLASLLEHPAAERTPTPARPRMRSRRCGICRRPRRW
jgi:hypothetical protein